MFKSSDEDVTAAGQETLHLQASTPDLHLTELGWVYLCRLAQVPPCGTETAGAGLTA